VIFVAKDVPQPFSQKQIELVSVFADQAVIAIENTRLLDDLDKQTKDLTESLQQQTATADVLKVISRSTFDLHTVLQTLAESAGRLCQAENVQVVLRDGEVYRLAAHNGFSPEYQEYFEQHPIAVGRGTLVARTALELAPVHIPDVLLDREYTWFEGQRLAGFRAMLGVPLLREGSCVGVMAMTRATPRPFTASQVELVTTFADQAVIAIENVRLFNELSERTRDLQESLKYQSATSEVLKAISRSTFHLNPVLQSVLETAARLCDAEMGFILRRDGEVYRAALAVGFSPEYQTFMEGHPISPGRGTVTGRAVLERRTIHIHDVASDPEYTLVEATSIGGQRTALGVPLLRESEPLGVIVLSRTRVEPFSTKQIELVTTFADQAVIAIENVRLFNEVQMRTEDLRESLQQQTATADVLKVISRSTFDLQTVLQTLVESAARLCDGDKAIITRRRDGIFSRAESFGFSEEFTDYVRAVPVRPDRRSAIERALLEGTTIHIVDVRADPDYGFNEAQKLGDFRTIVAVPMLREGVPVGVLTLTRTEVRPFTDKQIELLTTFADQAAIAIENVRLFENVESRTRELEASLAGLQAAQDRLVHTEKLASLGQLTAGIAHEIKNPLNFVNNFASLSKELAGELREKIESASLIGAIRLDALEIINTLVGNLDKVAQHGKRADSIVKNMLLHSREGTGEHRPTTINALVEESLNLAYHGARAERPDFNMKLERELDPAAGEADIFPQEITRVLLNLISNGFYAMTKRKSESGDPDFMPILSMITRSLDQNVEIRIRDNGVGIATEVRERMFNPFFTTKPAGEGTGLGLSISHDIVVKQHGGRLEVSSVPGSYTEFVITLPRSGPQLTTRGAG
jgi:two-component system NtrC family sensor kinase